MATAHHAARIELDITPYPWNAPKQDQALLALVIATAMDAWPGAVVEVRASRTQLKLLVTVPVDVTLEDVTRLRNKTRARIEALLANATDDDCISSGAAARTLAARLLEEPRIELAAAGTAFKRVSFIVDMDTPRDEVRQRLLAEFDALFDVLKNGLGAI